MKQIIRDENNWIENLIKEVSLATKRYIASEITRAEREAVFDTAYDAIAQLESKAVEQVKNEWFERGYKQGKLVGMMKEREKHDPNFLNKSLKKVVEALQKE